MIAISAFALIALVILLNGLLMIYDPAVWLSTLNTVYRKLMAGNVWFQYSLEPVRRGANRFFTRVAGVGFVYMSAIMFNVVIRAIPPGRGVRTEAGAPLLHPAEPVAPSLLGRAFLVPFLLYGALLAISPRRTLALLRMDRWMEVRPPEWGWRVVGSGLAVLCLLAFFS